MSTKSDVEAWLLRAQVSLRDNQPQVARVEIEKALQSLEKLPEPGRDTRTMDMFQEAKC